MWKMILVYLCVINGLAFVVYGVDKYRAKRNLSRVSEFNLLALAVIGGSVGAWSGVFFFHHKTKHLKFSLGLPLIFLAHIFLFFYLLK
jgi:uncharacterized membrane protein YsdA (DUF1294 family)